MKVSLSFWMLDFYGNRALLTPQKPLFDEELTQAKQRGEKRGNFSVTSDETLPAAVEPPLFHIGKNENYPVKCKPSVDLCKNIEVIGYLRMFLSIEKTYRILQNLAKNPSNLWILQSHEISCRVFENISFNDIFHIHKLIKGMNLHFILNEVSSASTF